MLGSKKTFSTHYILETTSRGRYLVVVPSLRKFRTLSCWKLPPMTSLRSLWTLHKLCPGDNGDRAGTAVVTVLFRVVPSHKGLLCLKPSSFTHQRSTFVHSHSDRSGQAATFIVLPSGPVRPWEGAGCPEVLAYPRPWEKARDSQDRDLCL